MIIRVECLHQRIIREATKIDRRSVGLNTKDDGQLVPPFCKNSASRLLNRTEQTNETNRVLDLTRFPRNIIIINKTESLIRRINVI